MARIDPEDKEAEVVRSFKWTILVLVILLAISLATALGRAVAAHDASDQVDETSYISD